MDRKGITGLLVIVALFGAWNFFYIRKSQEVTKARQQIEAAAAAEEAAKPKPEPTLPETPATPTAPGALAAPGAPAAPALESTSAEKIERISSGSAEYAFTNLGGGIKRATLLKHFAEKDSHVVLNQFGRIAIGEVSDIAGEGVGKPFAAKVDEAAGTVEFDRTDDRQIQLTKKFTLPKFENLTGAAQLREEYLITLDVNFTNRGAQAVELPRYYVHTGSAAPVHQNDLPTYTGFGFLRGTSSKVIPISWFQGGGFLFFKSNPRPVYPAEPETLSDVRWAAVTNQYFATICTPLVDEKAMIEEQEKQRGIAV